MFLLLFAVAVVAGALNAVAGGGSFLALPALIYAGISPVSANATTTFALWPAAAASSVAYRHEIRSARRWLWSLGAVSLVGGLIGGELLIRTSDTRFLQLLPWLMLAAVATFSFGGLVTTRLRSAGTQGSGSLQVGRAPVWMLVLQFAIAMYGGYFGGGMGIMMLAVLTVAGMTDIHEMNGLKALLAVAINGIALAAFVASGAIAWAPGLVMVAGGVVGGYVGASGARRLPPAVIRMFVGAIGWLMTVYFFLR